MTKHTRKYYVMVPKDFSYKNEPYWAELLEVKTLTAAQFYVKQYFDGLLRPVIGVSINSGDMKVVSRRNDAGKWEVVASDEKEDEDPFANDQIQYHLKGKRVSREDFYKYGFPHDRSVLINELEHFVAVHNRNI